MKKILFVAVALLATMTAFISCNVTRVMTNESSYFQRGDTTVTITTKTIETYEGTKK